MSLSLTKLGAGKALRLAPPSLIEEQWRLLNTRRDPFSPDAKVSFMNPWEWNFDLVLPICWRWWVTCHGMTCCSVTIWGMCYALCPIDGHFKWWLTVAVPLEQRTELHIHLASSAVCWPTLPLHQVSSPLAFKTTKVSPDQLGSPAVGSRWWKTSFWFLLQTLISPNMKLLLFDHKGGK